ncbi:Na-translocating system protein MpsC family protein, partial [Bacillus thuringiensis]|uniref:Na-translocating system protein MpsC family protein n=1 Tax=Bacillus thuringiensis TaxID=1428 RepID=UPI0020BEA2B5
ARTTLFPKHYSNHVPEGMEQLIGAKLEHFFTDIKIQEDIAVSVFIFDRNIEYGTESASGA